MFQVAQMLSTGLGVPERDTVAAAQWYERAANLGHIPATTLLADCYLRGLGVPKNTIRAVELLEVASNFGDTNATD
ncbi:MAG: sel1 repeat family protein, partial [Chthoniobacterales bacterium]|nr:sel1 repeat family protein [Chthoniobacterales bacterium]